MIYKVCLILACISAFVVVVHNKPVLKSGIRHCFGQDCPENAFACSRFSSLSEDKKSIIHHIQCRGLNDDVLKNITSSEDNPFGPDVSYQGYSYSGAYEITHSGHNDVHHITHNVDETDKNPNGEVEDLDDD